MTNTIKIGMRFDQRDTHKLRALAERARNRELGHDQIDIFAKAATAAATGEPLIVICSNTTEAQLMAAGYVRYGCRLPALHQVS